MKMVALKEFRHAGKQLQAGDPFDARDRDTKLLVAIKNAKLVDDEPQPDEIEQQQKALETNAKRTYKRRDMKAE